MDKPDEVLECARVLAKHYPHEEGLAQLIYIFVGGPMPKPRPAPDLSWVVTEPHPKPLKHPRIWGWGVAITALAVCTIAGALIAEAVNR